MPRDLVIVVASPNDVVDERNLVKKEVERINRGLAKKLNVRFEVRLWEDRAFPALTGDGAQPICDSVLDIPNCAIVVGILWSRLGDGTRHELDSARDAWKLNKRPKLMIYVSDAPPPNFEESALLSMAAVKRYRDERENEGLVWRYPNVGGFQAEFGKTLENLLSSPEGKDLIGAVEKDAGEGSIPKFIRKYRAEFSHFGEYWDASNIGVKLAGAEQPSEVRLESIYQHVRLAIDFQSEVMTKKMWMAHATPLEPAALIKQKRPLLIRGNAGAGKTTWMRRAFQRLIRNEAAVPFFVELRTVAKDLREKGEASFEVCLQRCITRDGRIEGLAEFLTSGSGPRAILLIDGWDELGERGGKMKEKLLSFLTAHPRVLAVVTSRPYGKGQPAHDAGFEKRDLQPLNEHEIELFVERFLSVCYPKDEKETAKQISEFRRALAASVGARKLAETPLLLTMMLGLSRTRTLPEERHKLYEACIRALLEERPKLYKREGVEFDDVDLPTEDERLRLTAEIAYRLQDSSEGEWDGPIVANWTTLEEFLPGEWSHERRVGFLEWLAGPAAILNARAGDHSLTFAHLSFQEFLAAWNRETALKTPGDRNAFVLSRAETPGWWETLQLWAALVEGRDGKAGVDPCLEALIQAGSPDTLVLAGKLFADGLGSGSLFDFWAPTFASKVSAAEIDEQRDSTDSWRASRQSARRAALPVRWGAVSRDVQWTRWLLLKRWLEKSGIGTPPAFPRVGGKVVEAVYTKSRMTKSRLAVGRTLTSSAPLWPIDHWELALLNTWPSQRRLVGLRLQSAASFGIDPRTLVEWACSSRSRSELDRTDCDEIRQWHRDFRPRVRSNDSSTRHWWISLARDLACDLPCNPSRYLDRELDFSLAAHFGTSIGLSWPDNASSSRLSTWNQTTNHHCLWRWNRARTDGWSHAKGPDLQIPGAVEFMSAESNSFGRSTARTLLSCLDRASLPSPASRLVADACAFSYWHFPPGIGSSARDMDPLWPSLARHISRQSTTEDRTLLEGLTRHPERREPPLSWGLQFVVRGDVMLEDGSIVTLDELCDQAGLPQLPYFESMPPEVNIDWGDDFDGSLQDIDDACEGEADVE